MTMDELTKWIGCDSSCPAQAMYMVKLIDGELAFCGHHYTKHKGVLDEKAYEVIELNKMEEAIPQLETAE
jgi:hypothetical protein